jgi:hypothetical protein
MGDPMSQAPEPLSRQLVRANSTVRRYSTSVDRHQTLQPGLPRSERSDCGEGLTAHWSDRQSRRPSGLPSRRSRNGHELF